MATITELLRGQIVTPAGADKLRGELLSAHTVRCADSWMAVASDQYDGNGKLYRSSFAFQSYSYDAQAPFGDTFAIYDFNSGAYNITGLFGPHHGLKYMTELPKDTFWSPEALAGAGLR